MSAICPYPGLRPFTEEESIYFKGRDEHIEQVIAQLEEKKFLMLTGASGDGKSSLVYAGLIPNARAGFFKATYNNWVVADFKPERAPLKQLSAALSQKLGLDPAETEKELGYGFSSLIKLYKSSSAYLDYESDKWKNADEKEKKSLKRKAANLLILADQFEEFFTNPENYSGGVSSKESQVVVNLLIETAKMALEQNLPIYIVCTMRSDYIGQCAAFRGLPEMIGYSQFFVPRLKRKEIHQVIVDPAILSGNKISNRLTETLINEMSEGFDQLPVLQHTLNGLWNTADKGNEEMDLLQLAKLAGISPGYLPKEDKAKFDAWFEQLPEFRKEYYTNFSLEQVLSAHSDILYKTAHKYYVRHNPSAQALAQEDTQLIIKTALQCLTKIDESRAVRNRMTLREITAILNRPEFSCEVVGAVLNIFREQGNTFISPFITELESSQVLKPGTVLDITHESLIRNWERLTQWANEEHESWLTYKDFEKQLQRWLQNKRSSGYLLPIGPLTFFENWFNTAKPNKYWLARYDESDRPKEEKLKEAEQTLLDAGQFIERSARNLFFSRTVLKYGARKILATIGITILVISCTYYYFDYLSKQNDNVIADVEEKCYDLLGSNKVVDSYKGEFIVNYERLHPGSFRDILNDLDNDSMAFDIAEAAFSIVGDFEAADSVRDDKTAYALLLYMDSRLENILNQQLATGAPVNDNGLQKLNLFLRTCLYITTNNKKDSLANRLIHKYTWTLNKAVHSWLNQEPDSLSEASVEFNQSLQLLTLLGDNDRLVTLDSVINKISPYEDPAARRRFDRLFPKSKRFFVEGKNFALKYNGGYYIMSSLFAAKGDLAKVSNCLDTTIQYTGWEKPSFFNPLTTLLKSGRFSRTGMNNFLKAFLKKRSPGQEIQPVTFIKLWIDYAYRDGIRSGQRHAYETSMTPYLVSNDQRDSLIDYYWAEQKAALSRTKGVTYDALGNETLVSGGTDELYYAQALYLKLKGMVAGELNKDVAKANAYYKKAFESYLKLGASDAEKEIWIDTELGGSTTMRRSDLFLYPGQLFLVNADIWQNADNLAPSFAQYIIDNNLSELYKQRSYLYFNYLRSYFNSVKGEGGISSDKLNYDLFDFGDLLVRMNPEADNQLIELINVNRAFENQDTAKAFNLIEKMDLSPGGLMNPIVYVSKSKRYLIKNLAVNLAVNGKTNEALLLLDKMEPYLRRNSVIDIAEALQKTGPVEKTYLYLDKFFDGLGPKTIYGMKVLRIIAATGSRQAYKYSAESMRDVRELVKPFAYINLIKGIIDSERYYEATQFMSDYVSSNKEMQVYNAMITHYIIKKMEKKELPSNALAELKKYYAYSGVLDYEYADPNEFKFDSLD